MARTRRRAAETGEDTDVELECVKARRSCGDLVQTALVGEVGEYVEPDHAAGESFPGPQPSTTQLSLFETGFKRKSGQMSLFETGFKRVRV